MNKPTYFNSVPVVPETGSVMSRLGHGRRANSLTVKDQSFVDETINLGLALCRNRGAAGRFALKSHTVETVTIADGTCIYSRQLAKMLRKSHGVLFMAGTAGAEISDRISLEMGQGNAATAVVLDAVASVSADMILDRIMDIFNRLLQKEGSRLTGSRYSPGFGDLALGNQAVIFRFLGLERLSLSLNASMMLSPEKSVLAIAGIERMETD